MHNFRKNGEDGWTKEERILVHYSHEFIYNFVGSLAGWIALYVLSYQFLVCTGPCHLLGRSDLGLAVLALLGITGKLPETIQGVIMSLAKSVEYLVKSLTDKVAKS